MIPIDLLTHGRLEQKHKKNMRNRCKLTPIDPFTRGDWQQKQEKTWKIKVN